MFLSSTASYRSRWLRRLSGRHGMFNLLGCTKFRIALNLFIVALFLRLLRCRHTAESNIPRHIDATRCNDKRRSIEWRYFGESTLFHWGYRRCAYAILQCSRIFPGSVCVCQSFISSIDVLILRSYSCVYVPWGIASGPDAKGWKLCWKVGTGNWCVRSSRFAGGWTSTGFALIHDIKWWLISTRFLCLHSGPHIMFVHAPSKICFILLWSDVFFIGPVFVEEHHW